MHIYTSLHNDHYAPLVMWITKEPDARQEAFRDSSSACRALLPFGLTLA